MGHPSAAFEFKEGTDCSAAVGMTRHSKSNGRLTIDRLEALGESDTTYSFEYTVHGRNPFATADFRGSYALLANTSNPSRCFLHHSATWDDNADDLIPTVLAQSVSDTY